MDRCDIIMPVWNQLEVTKRCVDSIVKNTNYPYKLIAIDNGSDAKTEEYLKGLRFRADLNTLIIRNKENIGFIKAVNQGIKQSDAPYVCITNNDTIATDNWLEEMISVMETCPDIGLLNPSSNTSGQFPETKESIDEYASKLKRFKDEIQELYTCRGFCMLVRRSVLDALGLIDEIYHFGYFDDTDYCKRAQEKGFRTVRAKAAYVYHLENTSFKEMKHNKTLFENNERIFFKKWGMPLRCAYFIDKQYPQEKIDDLATTVARNGHQILIFLKKGIPWPVKLDHFDIRKIDLSSIFFGTVSIYKILKRRKKKKLHILLTENKLFGKILTLMKPLHGADVIVNADKKYLIELLNKKSKCF